MQLVLGDIAWLAGWIITLIPLVFLPWWGEQLPRALRALDSDIAGVAADMLGDVDRTGRLVASEPGDAALAGGERLIWRAGQAPYDATFGRFRFAAPTPPPASADAALAALVASIRAQVRTLPEAERVAVFDRLARDKTIGLTRAGIGFVPAAKEAVLAREDAPALARAARGFLSAWVTQPVEEPDPRDLGYRERVTLFRALGDLEVPEIAIMARSIAERHPLDPAP